MPTTQKQQTKPKINVQRSVEGNETLSFEVKSGKICINDPCYTKGTWCGNFDLPAKNGKWKTYVETSDEGSWGVRVAQLFAHHEDFRISRFCSWERLPHEIGVDSGQASVFCSSVYPTDDESTGEFGEFDTFYGKVCFVTCGEGYNNDYALFGTVENSGVVSASGFGDGGYSGYCVKNDKGEIIAVRIDFITDEEPEEEEEEDNDENEQ